MDYLLFERNVEINNVTKVCNSLDAFTQIACKWIEVIPAKLLKMLWENGIQFFVILSFVIGIILL